MLENKRYITKQHLETQDVETTIPEKDVVPEMESFCNESFRLNVTFSEEFVFLFLNAKCTDF